MPWEKMDESFQLLKTYCENQQFKGWDPYDGLNSRFFQSLPFLRNNSFSRLLWIQLFKKSPVNFRRITSVKKDYNSKGIALFLSAYCNLYKKSHDNNSFEKIRFLADTLIELRVEGYSGNCWGYNFDWQARAFFQPGNTPTVVATSYVSDALFNAYESTAEKKYLTAALSAAAFVLNDLHRTYDEKGNFCFSYSPLDKTQVYNASMLGVRLLSRAYAQTGNQQLKEVSRKAVAYVCDRQMDNGAWSYGNLHFHRWIDNFHTGFNLECIHAYQEFTGDFCFVDHLHKGLDFYLNNFFTEKGESKYYNDKLHPIDIHSPAQLVICLEKLGLSEQHQPLIRQVIDWTITNMQDKSGYFYYQKNKIFTSKIPYMRWSQAWMFYALSFLANGK
jgi:rhamnogalacturonyl hydrolase YesR